MKQQSETGILVNTHYASMDIPALFEYIYGRDLEEVDIHFPDI